MNENREKRNQLLADQVIRGLESRNMKGYFADSKEEALRIALELIPEGSSVGWGGSVSVQEIGLKDKICKGNYKVYNREACTDAREKKLTELACLDADTFLCSSNAVTKDGVLVNIDGIGNRVAAIAWGAKQVVMIVGMNKIVKSVDDAVSRARNEAAPINAQRFNLDTLCCKFGACFDCKSPQTICCQFLVTRFSRIPERIKVILVNDDLGF